MKVGWSTCFTCVSIGKGSELFCCFCLDIGPFQKVSKLTIPVFGHPLEQLK